MAKHGLSQGNKKIKVTSGVALRLLEAGQIILNGEEEERRSGGAEVWRCGGESQRLPAAPSGDFSGFFFVLSGAAKVGYRCPTNPSPLTQP